MLCVNPSMMLPVSVAAILIGGIAANAFGQARTPQPAFEVVSIKPSAPQEPGRISSRMSTDPGRLAYTNVSLGDVIAQAYRIQHGQISGPEWMDSERFDIFAKIPDGVPASQIPQMLQALLADRFKLKLHSEKKELPAYVLAVAKDGPKIQKVESSGGLSIGYSPLRAHIHGNVSIPWLADYLSSRLGRPIQDQTHLEGPFRIALDWVPDMADDSAAGAATAVASGPSLAAAMQEQLGLKLVVAKTLVEIFVIDHLEKVPTEN
jgi:uncharacterized protein (TIGR03435 family)